METPTSTSTPTPAPAATIDDHNHVVIRNRISGNVVEVPESKVTPEIVGLIVKGQIISSVVGFLVGITMILRGSFMVEHNVANAVAYKIKIAWFEVESSSLGVLMMAIGVLVLILSYFWVRVTPTAKGIVPTPTTPTPPGTGTPK